MNLGLKLEDVREEVLNLLGHGMDASGGEGGGGGERTANKAASPRPRPWTRFGRDLTELARQGKLDPVIGRQNEIERVIQVLSPPHQEQPGPARRGRRRQDGHRRGPGPDDRRRQRPRAAARPADRRARPGHDGRRHQVPRPVRGADQGRHERGPPGQEHDPVHRRAAHPRRRRRRRRGDRRLQRAQAGPGPRRDPVHRRHHARRVPQVHREGRRPGAPVPDDHRQPAVEDRGARDPPRPARPLRGAPPRPDHRRGARGRRRAVRPLHHRPLPARQGDRRRSTRPAPASASRR